jgi:hypothetical protein
MGRQVLPQIPGAVDQLRRLLLVDRDAQASRPRNGQAFPQAIADPEPRLSKLASFQPDLDLPVHEARQFLVLPLPAFIEVEVELLARFRVDGAGVPKQVGRVLDRRFVLILQLEHTVADRLDVNRGRHLH